MKRPDYNDIIDEDNYCFDCGLMFDEAAYSDALEEYCDWLEKQVKDLEVACCYNDVYPCVHIEED